jgi:TonB family protein
MNTEKDSEQFDNAIDTLYVQRKNNLQAPEISLEENKPKYRFRTKGFFSIIALGSAASFGILAVMNHFAHLSVNRVEQTSTAMVFVNTIDVEGVDKDNLSLNMDPPKYEIKERKTLVEQPIRTFELNTEIEVKPEAAKAITLDSSKAITMVLVPETLQNETPQPTFKVMPVINRVSGAHKAGRVKLAYKLSVEGKVENIRIMQSNVHRDLEKSAKKALSQWRYPKQPRFNEELQVEFQFKAY